MIDVKKIVKYAGATLLLSTTIIVSAIVVSDSNFDHSKEECDLTEYLGIEHQMSALEKQAGWTAWRVVDYQHPFNPNQNLDEINLNDPNYGRVRYGRNIVNMDGEYEFIDNVVVARRYEPKELKLPDSKLSEVEPEQENIIIIKSNK